MQRISGTRTGIETEKEAAKSHPLGGHRQVIAVVYQKGKTCRSFNAQPPSDAPPANRH